LGQPAYRGKQIAAWIYERGAEIVAEMGVFQGDKEGHYAAYRNKNAVRRSDCWRG